VVSSNDSTNYLRYLQLLRQAVGNETIITAAVGLAPWLGPNSTPLTDVSAFALVLNEISTLLPFLQRHLTNLSILAVMAYDIYGAWSKTAGPNAPLNDACAPSVDRQGSAADALAAWTKANFPAEQVR
jgi:chitinase